MLRVLAGTLLTVQQGPGKWRKMPSEAIRRISLAVRGIDPDINRSSEDWNYCHHLILFFFEKAIMSPAVLITPS
uniref:Uncharacterized protein n=1 Tax=Thermosporothrix sp. COM3 TaxID=2490863 RepID=A0A455SJX6_9CHLR|nr:hypothetical protein KTC_27970 [Thermosporothrix sp. COM3]